jgi:hypothetical protein
VEHFFHLKDDDANGYCQNRGHRGSDVYRAWCYFHEEARSRGYHYIVSGILDDDCIDNSMTYEEAF